MARSPPDVVGVEGEVLAFFEDVGVYVRKGVIPIDLVWEHYCYYIEHYWHMFQGPIYAYRELTGNRNWFSNLEDLVARSSAYGVKKSAKAQKTHSDVNVFVESERHACSVRLARPSSMRAV
jgi:hypothetical protein